MKLEASDEVMEAIASVLHNAHDPGAAERVFGFARDYVLEEAAKVCEEPLRTPSLGLIDCARAIRAMKGTP